MDLALLWLHDEYLKQTVSVISSDNDYAFWLHKLLDGISKPRNEEGEYALDPKDRTFARFLMDVPELTTQSLAVVQEYCHSEERMPLGISTLRDMVLYRPAVRPPCLDQLLGLCLHPRT